MNQLTLEWIEAGQQKTYIITDNATGKHPGTIRLGRDPYLCDLVFSEPTVSGLQAEIFFDRNLQEFRLRSLRPSNPPRIDGQPLATGEMPLKPQSQIYLGRLRLMVSAIHLAPIPAPQTQLLEPRNLTQPESSYGLQCPKCQRISSYEHLDLGCPWCGTSLAGAVSVVL